MRNFLTKLFSPKLELEVVDAYLHKLPSKIAVSWKREDGFIIGKISYGGYDPIYTQARNPKEFIRMVNDAVYISLDFKEEYIEFFHESDLYPPTAEEWERLNDGKITQSSFGLASKLAHERVTA